MHQYAFIYKVSFINPKTKNVYESKIFKTVSDINKYYPFFTHRTWENIQNGRNTAFDLFVRVEKLYKDKDFKIENNKFVLLF